MVFILFWKVKVYFTVTTKKYVLPLNLSFLLIAFFIWVAENIRPLRPNGCMAMTIRLPVEYHSLFCDLVVVRRIFEKPFPVNGSDVSNECLVPSLYNLVKQNPVGLTVIEVSQHLR